jgi:hypothetical protein
MTAALLGLAILAVPVAAAEGPTMAARAMLDGHARAGGWVAVAVDLSNGGPPITGELRTAGGNSGRTRYAVPVDLPTQSEKRYVIHVQAPSFGGRLTVSFVAGDRIIAEQHVDVTAHDQGQLIVGIVAERPQQLGGVLRLLPGPTGTQPAVIALEPADLPDRPEAWSALDRLVWQDVDTDLLSTEQRAALGAWVANGGRLVIVGGTAGPDVVSGLPDDLLPFRPDATLDVPPAAMAPLLGVAPAEAVDIPGLSGELDRGRVLARVGDRIVAAETTVGAGNVTLIGVDPTTGWLATAPGTESLWRRLLPARTGGGITTGDDSQLLSAVSQLPSLALPPIGSLLLLLAGYIVLVGPVNYLILRRLDRREWAWITIPALIVGFSVAAYGIGAVLRGSDVIVHEIAIVRGSTTAGQGTSVLYAGVFSPSRGTYQVTVRGGALVSAPVNGDFFGAPTGSTALDIVQGEPAMIRDLAIGFGSLRAIRAEAPAVVPGLTVDLRLEEDRIRGSITNTSEEHLDAPALVFGSNVQRWPALAPGETLEVQLPLVADGFVSSLSEKVVGLTGFEGRSDEARSQLVSIRRSMVDQLTLDPSVGYTGALPADGPVLLGWTDRPVVPIELTGQQPRMAATTLYHLPVPLTVSGPVSFGNDLMTSTVVASDSGQFSKDPRNMSMGQGSLTIAYRPRGLGGAIEPTKLSFALNQGGDPDPSTTTRPIAPVVPAKPIELCVQQPCEGLPPDFLPDVEILDLTTSTWMALPRLEVSSSYSIDEPARYVDPGNGTVWIRFQNPRLDFIGFSFGVRLEGVVR